mmetsp:Transcript_851/g.1270  ORF Transcript_851/g.1270 Transcript_851/m.1270 type:complete len:111 (+) Transcript_851:2-334(+)
MKEAVTLGSCCAASAGLLLLSGLVTGEYWQLFNLIFFVLGVLPLTFGSHDSHGMWGSLGDFLEAVFAVSAFALPTVLSRVGALGAGGVFLCYLSNVAMGGVGFLMHKMRD